MRSRAVVILFAILLSTPLSANDDDLAEEMIPPPLDLDMRGTSLLWAGSPNKQAVALTFDDGPIPGKTGELLRILKENQAFATFFVVGSKASEHPELIQQVIAEGHEVGNHTQSHRNLTKAGAKEIQAEVKLCQEAVNKAVGFRPTLFRAPYGAANMTTLSVLSHFGLTAVFWSIDTRDWAAKESSTITSAVLDHIQNGDVILFHEHSSKTITALPGIIQELQKRGFVCVSISQLFDRPPAGPATVIASAKQSIRLPVVKTTSPATKREAAPERPVPDFVDMAPSEPEVAVAAKPAEEPADNGNGYAKPETSPAPAVLAAVASPAPVVSSPTPTALVQQAKAIDPVLPTLTPAASPTETALPSPSPTFTETETALPTVTETTLPSASPTPSMTASPTATFTTPPPATTTPTLPPPTPSPSPSPSPTESPTEIPASVPVVVKAAPVNVAGHPSPATKTLPLAKVTGKLTELAPVTTKSTRPAAPIQSRVNVEGPGALAPPPSQGKPIAPIPAIPSAPVTKPSAPLAHTNEFAPPAQASPAPASPAQAIPTPVSQPPVLHTLPAPPPSMEADSGEASIPKRVRRLTPVTRLKDTTSAEGKSARRSRVLTPVQENGSPRENSSWGYSEQPGT